MLARKNTGKIFTPGIKSISVTIVDAITSSNFTATATSIESIRTRFPDHLERLDSSRGSWGVRALPPLLVLMMWKHVKWTKTARRRRLIVVRLALCFLLAKLLLPFPAGLFVPRDARAPHRVLCECRDRAGARYVIRSVYRRSSKYEILAEVPRTLKKLRKGCILKDLSQDGWAFEEIPSLSHKHAILECDNFEAASKPLPSTACDINRQISQAIRLESERFAVNGYGLVACLAPLFGSPDETFWDSWLKQALVHYDHVFVYVTGKLDDNLMASIVEMGDFFTIIDWPMILRTGDIQRTEIINASVVMRSMAGVSKKAKHQLPYYGQYLELVDCQRRALYHNFSWFTPTELDLYIDTSRSTHKTLGSDVRSLPAHIDQLLLPLADRLVHLKANETSSQTDVLKLPVEHEFPRQNFKYVARSTTLCEACVHFLCCGQLDVKSDVISSIRAIHVRHNVCR